MLNSYEISQIKLSPNPSFDKLNIQIIDEDLIGTEIQFTVTNLLGQSIFQQDIPVFEKEWTYQLDVSSFPSGTYFLTLQNGGGIVSRKFMVQH